MSKFKDFAENTYSIPMIKSKKKHLTTDVKPEDRTFKNLPKYANGKSKVRFQDWLLIKSQKRHSDHTAHSFGKSEADGKWYGWSHRAVYGFKKGDRVEGDSGAKKVEYPELPNGDKDWDNGKYEPDFTIKSDEHAREVAIRFADSVS